MNYTTNFKTASNLSADFDSLRSLINSAITRNMVVTTSAANLAAKAQNMINESLLKEFQNGPAELKQQSSDFHVYLIDKVISTTFDELSLKIAKVAKD